MKFVEWFATRMYQLMLACYPPGFRAEFGTEMEMVFSEALRGIQDSGKNSLWSLVWREFRYWPGSVIQEHLQARRNTMTVQDPFTPIRPAELLAALAIFLIPTLAALLVTILGEAKLNQLPNWLDVLMVIFFLGSLLASFGFAVIRGFPRWSPPYLGILVVAFLLLGPFWPMQRTMDWAYFRLFRPLGEMNGWSMFERVLFQGVQGAILWFFVPLIALILITLLRLLPSTRSLWRRVREDWTQLSFLVYGGIVFYILLIFDEYQQKEIWSLAAWISLGIGCLLYLYSRDKTRRILLLLSGATLAMWIVATGKWFLVPIQDWGPNVIVNPVETERWFEFYGTLVEWICIVIALLSPAVLRFLPTSQAFNSQEERGSA